MRALLFRLVAFCLPLLVLLCVEGVWQLVAPERPFVDVPGHPEYMTVNPAYGARYFRGFQPQVAFNPFRKSKPDGTLRIVALGGSSTAGYPYHFYHAFPERLATQLRARAPLRRVEVVNLGMTAASSHVLRDLTPAVTRIEPDAVMMYAGHNEYYGAFGAGSSAVGPGRSLWMKRTALLLKRSKVFQGLERLIAPPVERDRTMMARSVGDASVEFEGEAYHAGLRQFGANLESMLRQLRAAGIPVYLATVVSNLAGQPPLGDNAAALEAYANGRADLESGDSLSAWAAFEQAKDLDNVRFRAPTPINEIIRQLAEEYGARMIDLAGYVWEDFLFSDHLHPTAAGHELMAKAFASALEVAVEGPPLQPAPDALERAFADLQIARLKNGFPFTKDVSPEQELRVFRRYAQAFMDSGRMADSLAALVAAQQLMIPQALLRAGRAARARGDTLSALMHLRALLYWQPFNRSLSREAVALAAESEQDLALSGEIVQLAVARSQETDYLNTLAAIRLRHGMPEAARALLAEVETREPDSPVMLFNMARLFILTGDTLKARDYFARYQRAAMLP